jgi:carbon storage regulator
MLVLARKKNESIDIDNGRINIMIIDVRGDNVRIGITAPRDVPVHRKEIQEAINRESLRLQSEHDTSSTDFD